MADVADAFGRTVADGWGTADVGGSWSTVGTAADYDVASGVGTHSIGVVNTSYRTHIGSFKNARIRAKVRPLFDPAGGSMWLALMARYADASNHYIFRLRIQPVNADPAQVMIQKQVGGVISTVVAEANITGNPASGTGSEWWWMEAEMDEEALRFKAWRDADSEPVSYQLDGTDSDLTAAGGVGCRSLASSSMSNTLPVAVEWDEFTAWEINKPKPDPATMTASVPTPSIKVTDKASPSAVTMTATTPDAVAVARFGGQPETLVMTAETYDAEPSKREYAVPAVTTMTGSTPSPTPSASSVATPGAPEMVTSVPTPLPTIAADAAQPETVVMVASVESPTLRVSEFATPSVIVMSASIEDPDIGLTQKITPGVVTMVASLPAPTGHTSDNATPGTTTMVASVGASRGSTSETAEPTVLTMVATTPDADGSESTTVETAVLVMNATVYGSGIIRASSVATPTVVVADCRTWTAQPLTGDPVEWEHAERVVFTQVLSPAPFEIIEEGIRYGRVTIWRP